LYSPVGKVDGYAMTDNSASYEIDIEELSRKLNMAKREAYHFAEYRGK